MTWLQMWIVWAVHVGAVFAVAYPTLYHHYADWRKHRIGRALMFKAVTLAALFVVSLLGYWWPFPGFRYIYAAVITLLDIALIRQTVVLVCTFRKARHVSH